MHSKLQKKLIAPIVITGITVGFLVSAYRFIFSDRKDSVLDPSQSKQIEHRLDQSELTQAPQSQQDAAP